MKQAATLVVLFLIAHISYSQTYDDYIGAGHSIGVTVTSSDAQSVGDRSIDGTGLDLDIRGASRFLARSTMGFTIEDVQALAQSDFETWIDNQMALPASNYLVPTVEIIFEVYEDCVESFGTDFCAQEFEISGTMWRSGWWTNTMQGQDQLRQRVAMALSEILVISDQSDLEAFPHGLAAYYDILAANAFGNYEDILQQVSLNVSMGFYLSHLNNPKTIETLNIRPDENYAREIMQLFSIGLYELNNDGSRKVNMSNGEWIPTYNNDDIKGLAKVFTGLSGSKWEDENNTNPVQFGRNFRRYSLVDPMKMYEEWHEEGEKQIVGGYTIPEGQSGMEDVLEAINVLFNHDNVGPFLAERLIQRLVKSNPTPAYIDRVATTFNNNGNGVRGDLKAVVKAILLDPEAYDCYWIDDISNGMLRSPMLRYTQLMKGLKAEVGTDKFYNSGFIYQIYAGQHVLSSPTVFNFYSPDYEPNADFSYEGLVGPEFQILNSSTSSNYVNYMLFALLKDYINERFAGAITIPNVLNGPEYSPYITEAEEANYEANLSDELWLDLAYTPEQLVDYLDILLTNGSLRESTKSKIVNSMHRTDLFTPQDAAHYAAFMILIDPDFVVLK